MHCRIISNISDLHPLDASSKSVPSVTNGISSDIVRSPCTCGRWEELSPPENHWANPVVTCRDSTMTILGHWFPYMKMGQSLALPVSEGGLKHQVRL